MRGREDPAIVRGTGGHRIMSPASQAEVRPLISVVMSVYDGAPYVEDTVHSVLGQEFPDFEYVIVDDGSTDETSNVLQACAESDRRIRIIRQPNAGVTGALIRACAETRGTYVARIDAGDRMTPGRLALQKDYLEECPDAAFVSCWTEFCGPGWEPLFVRRGNETPPGGMSVLPERSGFDLLSGPTHHGSVMFRRSAYERAGGYRAEFYYGQDWDLWYRLAERGKFRIIERVLYRARMLPGSVSARAARRQEAAGRCSRGAMRCRRRGVDESSWLRRAARIGPVESKGRDRTARASAYYFVAAHLAGNGDERAEAYLRKTLSEVPLHLKAWIRLRRIRRRS